MSQSLSTPPHTSFQDDDISQSGIDGDFGINLDPNYESMAGLSDFVGRSNDDQQQGQPDASESSSKSQESPPPSYELLLTQAEQRERQARSQASSTTDELAIHMQVALSHVEQSSASSTPASLTPSQMQAPPQLYFTGTSNSNSSSSHYSADSGAHETSSTNLRAPSSHSRQSGISATLRRERNLLGERQRRARSREAFRRIADILEVRNLTNEEILEIVYEYISADKRKKNGGKPENARLERAHKSLARVLETSGNKTTAELIESAIGFIVGHK